MYLPKAFRVENEQELHAFMRRFSFATLVSVIDGKPIATHLPLVLEVEPGRGTRLSGHIARANPHRAALESGAESLAIFQGEHAYVSPAWYQTLPAVPTWNYAAVHVSGRPRVMSVVELASFVDRLTQQYEVATNPASPYVVPAETRDGLIIGIVGFTMEVEGIEGKSKLSQNRSDADQRAVATHLLQSSDATAHALGKTMSDRLDAFGS